MNESIIKQITLLSTCIVLSVFPPYTCNNNMYTSYLYIIAEFPTICKASAKLEDLLLSLNFIVFKKIFLIQYSWMDIWSVKTYYTRFLKIWTLKIQSFADLIVFYTQYGAGERGLKKF